MPDEPAPLPISEESTLDGSRQDGPASGTARQSPLLNLLIANPTEGEPQTPPPGPSDSPDKDEPEGGTR